MFMAKPIKVWSDYYFHRFEGYFIKEDSENFYICNHFCYSWLDFIEKKEWVNLIQLSSFDKKLFKYHNCEIDKKVEEWVFEFPIHEENLKNFHMIADFFDFFLSQKGEHPVADLNKTILIMKKQIPIHILKPLVEFVLSHKIKDENRLRVMLSEEIRNILFTH